MKKIALLLFCFIGLSLGAQEVNLRINEGVDNPLKSKIEKNASALLTAINRAHATNSSKLNLSGVSIDQNASAELGQLYFYSPFFCIDNETTQPAITTRTGYQIRRIPLELTPKENADEIETYQEGVIDFDKAGNIISFYIGLKNNDYQSILNKGNKVGDFARRQMILDYVERFKTAYNQKNINFIKQVFSDDALIITGKVITARRSDGRLLGSKVKMITKTKKEYIRDLENNFRQNKFINVKFDNIEIFEDNNRPGIYAVSLLQHYKSSTYKGDVGNLFLLWDFRDEDHPQIHVRVWEPEGHYIYGRKFKIQDLNLNF